MDEITNKQIQELLKPIEPTRGELRQAELKLRQTLLNESLSAKYFDDYLKKLYFLLSEPSIYTEIVKIRERLGVEIENDKQVRYLPPFLSDEDAQLCFDYELDYSISELLRKYKLAEYPYQQLFRLYVLNGDKLTKISVIDDESFDDDLVKFDIDDDTKWLTVKFNPTISSSKDVEKAMIQIYQIWKDKLGKKPKKNQPAYLMVRDSALVRYCKLKSVKEAMGKYGLSYDYINKIINKFNRERKNLID